MNDYLTDEQVINMFEDGILPHVVEQYGKDDEVAIRTAFNDYTDALCKDGLISDKQYNDMENPY